MRADMGELGEEAGHESADEHEPSLEHRPSQEHRSGFIALIGRPNTGKSTLVNALVGDKIAITSNRPQTTRHIIRGIVRTGQAEIVLVDTPGLHKPKTLLGRRLNDLVAENVADVDAVLVCTPANEEFGAGDMHVIRELKASVPAIAVVTKTDLASRAQTLGKLVKISGAYEWADIVPVSAREGHNITELTAVLAAHVPPGPQLYPSDALTDEPDALRIAELIREAALEGVRDELPHSMTVLVDEMNEPPAETPQGRLEIRAEIYVERDSQKAIIIGKGASRLKMVRERSRGQIETMLGRKIRLDLYVRVAKNWQGDPKMLARLGF